MNRRELEEKLVAWAWRDAAFKQDLIRNPKTAIENKGIKLPANIEFRVVEETSTILYLVIPVKPN